MLNATAISTTVADFFAGFAPSTAKTTSSVRKPMRAAYQAFAAEHQIEVDGLFDAHFLAHHGEPIVADFVLGRLTRHQAAVDLAHAWETHLISPAVKLSKPRRADAVMTADRFLSYLPV